MGAYREDGQRMTTVTAVSTGDPTEELRQIHDVAIKLTDTALILPEDMAFEDWLAYGQRLDRMSRAVMWWLGDWWAFGEHHYGERAKAVKFLPWAFQTCRNAGSVARKFETSRRRDVLPWSHHECVAKLDADDQEDLLNRWEVDQPDRAQARAEANALKRERDRPQFGPPSTPLTSLGPFDVLYADPPWRYEQIRSDNRAQENHYPTMPLDEIKALQPPVLDDAILFLWATAPKLAEAMQVIGAWGFDYRT
jgi:hypothetical protein